MPRWRRWLRRAAVASVAVLALGAASYVALDRLDRAYPPPLPEELTVSTEVLDRDGQILRAFATVDGRWRLKVEPEAVDQDFIKMLVAYEDKRFFDHPGVDAFALGRAALQFVSNGRIVSGGSTLSMQVARLIEPRESRSFGSKFRQMLRALQIERRLSKGEILQRYLTLAPYGGNLEGVRAASLAYFGKEPKRLSVSEAAMLVALPQLPERRRPDKHPVNAGAARERVLQRMVSSGVLSEREAERAGREPLPEVRMALPSLAAHLADAAVRKSPSTFQHKLTIRKSVQSGLEQVARAAAEKLGPKLSVAMVLADARTGEILGQVGSADFFDHARSGWIDMTRVSRSPGSTLKPFIYGLAFEQGIVAQETMIEDRPADFGGYRPRNFDMSYQGDVTVRQALQLSLNVPAIRLLDSVGPSRLMARFRQAGVNLELPDKQPPGLAIGLGGAGISLRDLVQLYTGLANGGKVNPLRDGTEATEPTGSATILDDAANWQIGDILVGVKPPEGALPRGIAYKTGTSYGYRDAWSVGYDGRYVLGVWVGRADGGSVPGLAGYVSAAPILFEGFQRSGLAAVTLPSPPPGVIKPKANDLPVTLARFSTDDAGLVVTKPTEPAPRIVFPPDGARVELAGSSADGGQPLVLKLQGGRAPFRWLANGKPLAELVRRRQATWQPDTTGFSTLTVIDAAGRAASVKVFVE